MFDTRPEQKSSTVRRRSGRRAKHRRSRRLQLESLESRVLLATFVVSSSDDSGRGTLREAITLANANPGKDLIDFNFQELEQIFMPGNVTFNLNWGTVERGLPVQAGLIRPRTPLPEITDPVIIDGSISGFSLLPVPGVEIRGDRLEDSETAGLRIASDDVELRGLILNSFPKTAVELRGSRFSTLAGNYIGAHFPENGGSENETGIQLFHSDDNTFIDNVVAENSFYAIQVDRHSDRNVFHRNLVADNSFGFFVQGSRNRVGGDADGTGNLIANHFATGVDISGVFDAAEEQYFGGDGNWVQGNVITGNGAGVEVYGGARSVIIGGANAEAANTISANETGVAVRGDRTSVTIRNNFIGTNPTGDSVRFDNGAGTGNLQSIEIQASSDHDIRGNVIGGNNTARWSERILSVVGTNLQTATPAAILVYGGSSDIEIRENFIGVGEEEGVRLFNYGNGISILDSTDILIHDNVISGSRSVFDGLPDGESSGGRGLLLDNSHDVDVTGNFIGTDASGSVPVPNQSFGIVLLDSSKNQIGHADSGGGNLVSGNQLDGIVVFGESSTRNRIQGNRIGTDAEGTSAIPNGRSGIVSNARGVMIGGPDSGQGNLVSGNREFGIEIFGASSTETRIQGNRVGTDVSGLDAIPNGLNGIDLVHTHRVFVGGSEPGEGNTVAFQRGNGVKITRGDENTIEGNVIVSNQRNGVLIEGPDGFSSPDQATAGNRIIGNEIGKINQGNGGHGVQVIYGPRTVVGGSVPGEGNGIRGNQGGGVWIEGSNRSRVLNNGIRSNSSAGVLLNLSENVDLEGNTISGNGSTGVALVDSVGTRIYQNEIAVNDEDGITIVGESFHTVIGRYDDGASLNDAVTGDGNIIRNNAKAGVWIAGGLGHTLAGNSIHGNATLGIEIGVLGVDPIDQLDADREGPNEGQNSPVLEAIIVSDSGTRVEGQLRTARNSSTLLQFFSNPTPSPGGNGQGKSLIHEFEATSDTDGIVEIDFTLDQALPPGATVAATATVESERAVPGSLATEVFYNTSEFSNFVQVPSSETQVNTRVAGSQSGQDVAIAGDGSYVVAWTGPGEDDEPFSVEFRRFMSNGVPIDETPIQVNTKPGRFVRDTVSVAMNDRGEFVVAWMDQTPDDSDHFLNLSEIYYRRFDADGRALDDVQRQANTIELGQQAQPGVGMSDDGGFVIVWASGDELGAGRPPGDGDYRGIFARRFSPDGTALDPTEFQVNEASEGDQAYPVIDVTSLGSFIIAWTDEGGSSRRDVALARVYNPDGTIRTDTFRLNRNPIWMNNFASEVDVALTDSGSLVATWIDAETQRPFFQRFTREGLPIVSVDFPRSAAWGPRVDSDALGAFSITWSTPNSLANGFNDDVVDVFVRDFTADGGSPIGERRVHDVLSDWQYAPQIAVNRTGDYALAWRSNEQDGDRSGIYSRAFNPRPDIVVQQFTAGGGSDVTLRYRIDSRAVNPFDIEVVLATPPNDSEDSGDQLTLSTLRIDEEKDLQPGEHEKVFSLGDGPGQISLPGVGPATFDGDYEILLIADPADTLAERDRDSFAEDNTVAFQGVYRTADGQLFVHGDARPDIVRIEAGSIVVSLGGRRYVYEDDQVSSIEVRSQGGDDRIIADTEITKPLLGWGGAGNDLLLGGSGADVLRGGPGNDEIAGGPGDDLVDGGEGNDVLNGGPGVDAIRDDLGTNRASDPDGDAPQSAYLTVTLNRNQVTEGDPRTPVRMTVTRFGDAVEYPALVQIDTNSNRDIRLPPTIEIAAGSNEVTFDVSIRNDSIEMSTRVVSVNVVAEGYLGSTARLTILEDDPRPDPILVVGGGTQLNLGEVDDLVIAGVHTIDIRGYDAMEQNGLILDASKFVTGMLGPDVSVHADANDSVIFDAGWEFDGFRVFGEQRERQFSKGDAILRLYGPTDFTNPINPLDVNASGNVTPLDALVVINYLNRGTNGSLPPVTPGEVPSSTDSPLRAMSFFDVTADAYITPLDALRVINKINRQEDESAGESISESTLEKKIMFGGSEATTDHHPTDEFEDDDPSIHLPRSNDNAHGLVDATVTSVSNQVKHSILTVLADSAALEHSLIDLALLQEWSDPFEPEWL